ncbi:MAG: ChbG/HpnK family deacetylase, partial [Actinobacteria bacterium]|nr:ChbG/HpnK family deacetylase [Actinomycetota bacterium]
MGRSLNQTLGYDDDARLVILSCDDLGAFHASNVGVLAALHDGAATCASLMVPAPWARHAVSNLQPDDDIGVHLTLVSEHAEYRWGPLTYAPSLQSGDGGFPATLDDLWEHADPDEVLRECRAQIERALLWNVDVTHLAPHLTSITLRPEFFDVYLQLAAEFRLPIRLPSSISTAQAGFDFRGLARDEGV